MSTTAHRFAFVGISLVIIVGSLAIVAIRVLDEPRLLWLGVTATVMGAVLAWLLNQVHRPIADRWFAALAVAGAIALPLADGVGDAVVTFALGMLIGFFIAVIALANFRSP